MHKTILSMCVVALGAAIALALTAPNAIALEPISTVTAVTIVSMATPDRCIIIAEPAEVL